MRRRTKAGVTPTVAALLLLLLGGCTSGHPLGGGGADALADEIRGFAGGECLQSTPDGRPDLAKRVPCDEPHAFEIVRTVEVPSQLEGVSWDTAGDEKSDLNAFLMDYTVPLCADDYLRITGVQDIADTVPELTDAGLLPVMSGNLTVHLPPEDVWDVFPAMVCAISWIGADGLPAEVVSRTEEPDIASFGSPTADDAARLCLVADGNGYAAVPCSQAHYAEALFQYDAGLALGAEWAAAVDVTALTEEQWSALDAVCAAGAPAVFGSQRTAPDVAVLADVPTQTWGVSTPGGGAHPVLCLAVPTDAAMLLDGPVWGLGDEPATLIPAT